MVGYGYVVSAVYALIEGRFDTTALFRADILHCIGLSMVTCALLLLGRTHIFWRAMALSVLALLLGIAAGRWLPKPHGFFAPVVALFVDVAPYTRFPLLPLCGFTAVGVAVGSWLLQRPPLLNHLARLAIVTMLLVALVSLWQYLTGLTLAWLGGRLSRSHPAVVWNFLEGCTRALAVLFASLFAANLLARSYPTVPSAVTWLVRLGRGSLLAYAVHIPLCYGRLAHPIAGRLQMPVATVLVVALIAFTYLVVLFRDLAKKRRRTAA